MKVEIYFPIISDLEFENYPFEQREIVINEISDILALKEFKLNEFVTDYSSTVKVEDFDPFILTGNPKISFLTYSKEDLLKFTFEVEVDMDLVEFNLHKDGKITKIEDTEEKLSYLSYELANEFGNKVFEILLLSQIARPGSLRTRDGITYTERKLQTKVVPHIINTREDLDFQRERAYPNIQYLKLTDFYRWVISNNLLFPTEPSNSFQEALNNFSYLNGKENEISRFIYQMRTLERIYTDDNTQIAGQLDKKIQLFLGPMEKFKRQIKDMYDVRSKFLHGSSKLIPYHKKDDCSMGYDQTYEYKLSIASTLSILLIIATLQKMYLENYFELNFEYKVTRHNPKK